MKISFLGDIAFVGKYNQLYKEGINPFSDIESELMNSDFVIGNLECLASGDKGENKLKNPRLKTNLDTLNYLNNLNISVVSLAHNHVYDNLDDGYSKTIKYLHSHNIKYLGSGFTEATAQKPQIIEKDGIKICLLNYVTHDTNPSLSDNCPIHLNWFDEKRIQNDISKIRDQVDHIVLLLHWGGDYEGSIYPNPSQSETAKRLIDYGADLIIGHHSHTFQPYEIYKDKYIFHSLGNFCFVDFESDSKKYYIWKNSNLESAIINIEFSLSNYNCSIIPIKNISGRIYYYTEGASKYIKRNKFFIYLKRYSSLWQLYKFINKRILPYYTFAFNPNTTIFQKFKTIISKLK